MVRPFPWKISSQDIGGTIKSKAIKAINKYGILLVYPLNGKKEPHSLWSEFYPRSQMNWAWDDGADDRVNDLWILMKELSVSKSVVYSKWYKDRGTFFSKEAFASLLSHLRKVNPLEANLFPEAQLVYSALSENSPLSTKELKEVTELKGKFFQSTYNNSLRHLYRRGLIVSFGEKDDGVFPSACMGATQLIFEDLWKSSFEFKTQSAQCLEKVFKAQPSIQKQFQRIQKDLI